MVLGRLPELNASEICSAVVYDHLITYIELSFSLFSDLRKFRSYRGSSLRDLLRAMRNKVSDYQHFTERDRCRRAVTTYTISMLVIDMPVAPDM